MFEKGCASERAVLKLLFVAFVPNCSVFVQVVFSPGSKRKLHFSCTNVSLCSHQDQGRKRSNKGVKHRLLVAVSCTNFPNSLISTRSKFSVADCFAPLPICSSCECHRLPHPHACQDLDSQHSSLLADARHSAQEQKYPKLHLGGHASTRASTRQPSSTAGASAQSHGAAGSCAAAFRLRTSCPHPTEHPRATAPPRQPQECPGTTWQSTIRTGTCGSTAVQVMSY